MSDPINLIPGSLAENSSADEYLPGESLRGDDFDTVEGRVAITDCSECIHKEVCKYRENMPTLVSLPSMMEPFRMSVTCDHYREELEYGNPVQ